jgi:hypothetical protein
MHLSCVTANLHHYCPCSPASLHAKLSLLPPFYANQLPAVEFILVFLLDLTAHTVEYILCLPCLRLFWVWMVLRSTLQKCNST